MKRLLPSIVAYCALLTLGLWAAQSPTTQENPSRAAGVPRVIKFSGQLQDAAGAPRSGTVGLLFAIYGEQKGGSPLWQETQNVQLDSQGRYSLLLGSHRDFPTAIFAQNGARWLGVQVLADAEPEQSRILLVSVPYALKAQDAETLGGRPASAYVLSESLVGAASTKGGSVKTQAAGFNPEGPVQTTVGPATTNAIPKFSGTDTLADSMLFELYNQPATDAFGHVLSNEDVVRLGDGTGLNKRLEIDGRMVAEGFDVVTALPNSVHVVNTYVDGVGFQGNANGIGFSTGFAGTSRGLNGAGVRAFALPPLSLQPQAPGDYTYGVLTSNYQPQGAGVAALSGYDGTAFGADFPVLTEAIGLYAGASHTSAIAAVFDQQAAGGGKLLSARLQGTEVISMTSAGNITASGTITATAGFSGSGAGLTGVAASTANDLNCAGCVAVSELGFDPATQAELDAHKTSSDHDTRYVLKAGDTLTGALNLPANGLVAGTNQLVIASGNVGIGTATPNMKLRINNSADQGGLYLAQTNTTSSMPALEVYAEGLSAQNALMVGSRVAGFDPYISGLLVRTDGTVGIGTSTPAFKLDVAGTIRSSTGGFRFPDGTTQTTAATGSLASDPAACAANNFVTDVAANGTLTCTQPSSSNLSDAASLATKTYADAADAALDARLAIRGINYIAGCDSCNLLQTTDSQKAIYMNVVGAMTINQVTCISDVGSPTINLQRDDGISPTNVLSSDLTCTTAGATTIGIATSALGVNHKLDFYVTGGTGFAHRVTVVVKTTVN